MDVKAIAQVDSYISTSGKYQDILVALREIIRSTELQETIKWRQPTYTLKGKNVLSICSFKNGAGIWFFNGALLQDKLKILMNAQEGKTHGMRRWLFSSLDEVVENHVLEYVQEAIKNEKSGLKIKAKRGPVLVTVPHELQDALNFDNNTQVAFNCLSPSKRKDYCEYIAKAKKPETKINRLQKIIPMIISGVGLNDKYIK